MSNKARNLEILRSHGVKVPSGFTLPPEHYQTVAYANREKIVAAIPSSEAIRRLMLTLDFPYATDAFLTDNMARMPHVKRFAVRSSGSVVARGHAQREDDENCALAGQFESFIGVRREQVPLAVKECWASLFNERSMTVFDVDRSYVENSLMTVLVQEMIPAKASAVMMTVDPLGDGSTGALEFTWGPCAAIVNGIVVPDEVVFDRATGAPLSTAIGAKEWTTVHSDSIHSDEPSGRRRTLARKRAVLSLSHDLISELIEIGRRVEQIFGKPQDIEAVINPRSEIVITQSRPVTVLPSLTIPFANQSWRRPHE